MRSKDWEDRDIITCPQCGDEVGSMDDIFQCDWCYARICKHCAYFHRWGRFCGKECCEAQEKHMELLERGGQA